MKRRRTAIILALGLLYGLAAGPRPAAAGDFDSTAADGTSTASAVTVIRHELRPIPTPPPPEVSDEIYAPSTAPAVPPVFDARLLREKTPATPEAPDFSALEAAAPAGVPVQRIGPSAPVVVTAWQLAPGRWRLTADRVIGQNDSEYVDAVGHAFIVKGTDSLRADFIRYYKGTRWVFLRGHVRIIWEGDLIEAKEAEFDLANRVGWFKHGKLFKGVGHLYVKTDYARKYADSSYRAQDAKITGCDGEKPAWDLRAEEADISLLGRTKLWNAVADVKNMPAAYFPYLVLPGGARRQSGLLAPDIGHSTNRGFTMDLPYYWVIDAEHDMTFYENYMSSRGLMQGLEFRQAENPDTKGDWRFDYLNDRVAANTLGDEEKYAIDNLLRPNHNRWWLRSKFNGFVVDPEWKLKLDLDFVSDQNYLREFESGLSGFEKSRTNFLRDFGRDIDVADSLTRTSTAFVSRDWEDFGLATKFAWTENLAYRNDNGPSSKDPTTQTLPEVNFFVFKNQVPDTPFDFEATSQFDYFWRRYGTRAVRADVHPTLSLPLPVGPFTFIPTAGFRNTAYSVDRYENESAGTTTNKTPARTMYEMGFTGFTELSRVYSLTDSSLEATSRNVGQSRWEAIRHSIIPRVEFDYVPAPQSEDRLPVFDSLDHLSRQNLITYSLTNVFDRRRVSVVAGGTANATVPTAVKDYVDFFTLRLEQSYDRDEAGRTTSLDTYPRRPFSDIMAEAVARPEKYVAFSSRTYYSPYLGRFTEHEHSLTLTKDTLGQLRFSYDYLYPLNEYKRQRTNDVQVLQVGADYHITDKLTFTTDYHMDLAAHSDLEKRIGFRWKDQCYALELLMIRKPSDTSFALNFNVLDFGKP